VAIVKPSPVPAAVLAVAVLAWLPVLALRPAYRGLDLAHGATLLAAAAFLTFEAVRTNGALRALAAGGALLAATSRLPAVRGFWFLVLHDAYDLFAYGVPTAVGAVLVWIARRRAAAGG
jgi:hypothetical protein